MGMAPSSRSRIQDARGGHQLESSDNDAPSTTRRTRPHENGSRTADPSADIPSDAHNGVGVPTHQDDNQGADKVDKEDENVQDNEQNVAYGEEGYNNGVDEPVNGDDKHVGSKRTRSYKPSGLAPEEELGSSNDTQKEPNGNGQGTTTRRRGRPPKNSGSSVMSTSTSLTKSSLGKRKRDITEDGPRRSSRAAAESASRQITEQSTKRPKVSSMTPTPSVSPKKKAASSLGTPSKSTPSKGTRTKTSTKHEFEVEYILQRRQQGGGIEYLVKWKGYNANYNTWEPTKNLTHCPEVLKQFNAIWSKGRK